MKKKILMMWLICFSGTVIFSQTGSIIIKGKVTDEKNEILAGASVNVKGTLAGGITNEKGVFRILVKSLPVTLVVSYSESETKEIVVSSTDEVSVSLQSETKTLDQVIVGDSRISGKRFDKPITMETVGKTDILNSPTDPYGTILSKRALDVTISSLTYKTYSTRGFNGSGSSRITQQMDGMDNIAPGLGFSVGNFAGLTDLDIESIEILPGASSALYGPGGVNGTFLLNSKSPFKNDGFSMIIKNGITDVSKKQREKIGSFHDFSIRWAKNFNNKFAFKIGAQYLEANDWLANDTTNYQRMGSGGKTIAGTRQTDPNYDGVNVYGDETSLNMRDISNLVIQAGTQQFVQGYRAATGMDPSQAQINGFLATNPNTQPFYIGMTTGIIPNQNVSRTGYNEINTIDPKTKNLKLSGAVHYKFNDNLEAILSGYWGTGNSVYTGNNRYAFKGIKIGQYKLELKHKNWFLRGYTTQENAGDAYSATVTSQYFNEAWKPSGTWYPQYIGNYVGAIAGGASVANAHLYARSVADQGRPLPGSALFTHIFDSVRKVPIPKGGLFLDKSQLWVGEGQYSFTDKIKFADVLIGGNLKKYILNSQGTIFIDTAGALKIIEWGAYAQVTKKLLNEKLVVSASGRYDKNENFKGKFTPRFTALIKLADGHNLRMSYQTAYKFPTTQQQWIKLDVGSAVLLGGLPWVLNMLKPETYPTYVYDGSPAPPVYTYKSIKPESMRSFEAGYKGYINKKLLLDAYVYAGKYTNFLGRIVVIQPTRPVKPWSVAVNSDTEVKTWGAGISLDYQMAKKYFSFINAYTDNLTDIPAGFEASYNTPKYRMNAGFGNSGLGKKGIVGFNVNLRWQDSFYWEGGGFANGDVKAYTTLDAQVNYKLKKLKSQVKIGGTNITNKFYQTGFGNPYIGGMYYVSFAYNIL